MYRAMLADHPLVRHQASGAWIVCRYDDVEFALKDRAFSNQAYMKMNGILHGRSIIHMDGREHATHRVLVLPSLRGADFERRMLPAIEGLAASLVGRFRHRGTVDLVEEFTEELPINVMRVMLGLPEADAKRFSRWYHAMHAFFYNLAGDPAVTAAGFAARDELRAYLDPLIGCRRRDPGDDLLSTLVHAEVDGERLSDEDVKAFCSLLLTAGGQTTAKALASLVMNLLLHPDQLAAVRHDRSLIDRALAETLRYAVPVQMAARRVAEDVEFSGGPVPAGSEVFLMLGAANRDPRRFGRPEEFDLFRPDLDPAGAFTNASAHLGFGRGRHFCVGAVLTRHEVSIALNLLLDELADVRFAVGFVPREEGHFARGPKRLLLCFSPA